MDRSFVLFKSNIKKIINNDYKLKKQKLSKGSYYSRNSINYSKMINIKVLDNKITTHNKIRSLIFPPFQLPIYKGKKIIKSKYSNKKIKLYYL